VLSHPVLRSLAEHGVKMGLDRVRSFLQTLGEPHRAYPVVHIGGTNGKGSVTTMVTAALVDAGYHVGTNISPHLEAVNERIQIDGLPIDDGALAEGIEALDRVRWDWAHSQGVTEVPLTYFEFVTTLAFQTFAQRNVDVAVVEVGMGGRLDATNVVKPVVCAITHVGLDHMAELGSDVAEIAREKAGIIKTGAPVVVGTMPAPARDAIEDVAKRVGAPAWIPGRHLTRERRGDRWRVATPDGAVEGLRLAMPGDHQGANAMVAVGVLHALRRQGFHIPDEAIRSGLERARIGGRIEELRPGLWVDGAHNPDGTKALSAWLATRPRPKNRILLFGMGQDRDPVDVITPLLPHVDEVVTTRCAHPKARESLDLATALQDLDVVLSDGGPVEEALPEVLSEADEVLVAGSLYLVGAVKSIVRSGTLDDGRDERTIKEF
jgi:dihydrofolate synthase/folylpolyglutamate synthase